MATDPPHTTQRRAHALWTVGPRATEIREETLAEPGNGLAVVRTLFSGISRGTEMIVHRNLVPPEIATLMRAPFQMGDFPHPVKYGYLSVGIVEQGPGPWVGQRVFCLHPHQDRYVVPVEALTRVPDEVPDGRALLAGALETAINALWDCSPRYGDRIAVVGAGIIGSTVATLLRKFPLQRLQLVDPDPEKQALADLLGIEWVHPDQAMVNCDIVYHASATPAGLAGALAALGTEGHLVELSWFGTDSTAVPLGHAFHARRLTIHASQVGTIAPSRRARRTHGDRMELALAALSDPIFDHLLGGTSDFEDMPEVLAAMDRGELPGMLRLIRYQAGT